MGFFIHEDQKDDADDDATDDGQRDQAGGQNDAHGDEPEEEGDVQRHTNVTGGEDKRLTGVLKKENAEKLKLTLTNVQETISDVTGFINKWGEEIRAYSEPIAKGLQYGPDYVLSEVESIYGHYLKQGIGWTDEQLGKIEQLINECKGKTN